MVAPIVEAAAVELGPLLARAGVALLGGAVVAGTGSLSGDTPNEHRKATPDVRAVSRTGGFQREACLLQETKGDYDQFLDEDGDRTCQEFRVLRSVKRSQLMAAVNRSPNRMAN
ncbi:Tox-REase-5 domain-containing protein [Burkholderia multivorans]|nr:Tox-REase-5 domain-containing protein [Burkholderia multivorans]